MPTPKAQALAKEIQTIFLNSTDADGGLYFVATLIDQHTESLRIDQLEKAIGIMYDSQHTTKYGQE